MPFLMVLRIFIPFALGYMLASVFRSITAVITPDLVRDTGMDASELGLATSAFFLSATIMQIPYGVLLDRYEPRRVYAVFLLICAAGAVVASLADNGLTFAAGRALIALGTTASAVTSYKVYAMWYPASRLPLANGLSLSAGSIGMMLGTLPVQAALAFMDWRAIHLIVAAMLVLAAVGVLALVPARQPEKAGEALWQQFKGLGEIIGSSKFWHAAPLLAVVAGMYGGLIQLWSGPWIRDVAGLSGGATANVLFLAAGAMVLSGIATGPLSGLTRRLGLPIMGFAVLASSAFTIIVFLMAMPWVAGPLAAYLLWGVFGIVAPLTMVMYAALGPEFPKELNGRLNACLTLSWLLGAFLVQNIYGFVLDRFPNTETGYAPEGHRLAMGINFGILVVTLAWYFVFGAIIRRWAKIKTRP
ncbi:MAG: MFS transporter [Rhodospirillaceae bacterium]|nr:MFS transporter [Rhodospirillaceae bacterium]MBT3884875.1 MFS transporter [Rhodospirillaceae bacterium]MBT4115816.1 MFS transporter [Rhodospirillaceae bacterium]MBT4673222.1 MFS transporter [Rhodospirillaceae bacterium]MBT5178220.1 MFS transporter [Rhodospirillaceae bacterium]